MKDMKTKSIVELTAEEVKRFLLKSRQYCTLELPDYLDFDNVLKDSQDFLKSRSIDECVNMDALKSNTAGVNHSIRISKGRNKGTRDIVLTNPVLYCLLVNAVSDNWNLIVEILKSTHGNIVVSSIPVVPNDKEPFHNSTSILNWWNAIEQGSLRKSLKFKRMLVTDISHCYESISLESVMKSLLQSAIDVPSAAKVKMANDIIRILEVIELGNSSKGLPQGSVVYDLLAEVVLSYVDYFISEEMRACNLTDKCSILRYRDDYRVFSNSADALLEVQNIIKRVLSSFSMAMNLEKTFISEDIVSDALKKDKVYYIEHTPIYNGKQWAFKGIAKHLYHIKGFGDKFPDSGQLKRMLGEFSDRISDSSPVVDLGDIKVYGGSSIAEDPEPIIAIAVRIAEQNPTCIPQISRIIGQLSSLQSEDKQVETNVIVCQHLMEADNSNYAQVWLQKLTNHPSVQALIHYDEPLCKYLSDKEFSLWDFSFLREETLCVKTGIVDDVKLNKEPMVPNEVVLSLGYE